MKTVAFLFSVVAVSLFSFVEKPQPKVLVFCKTAGFHHKSIPAGIAAIRQMGLKNGFEADTTTNAFLFTEQNLKRYAAIVFLNTTGTLFDSAQRTALQGYVRKGGGIAGVHAATDTEYGWPWYGRMIGGYFESHPKQQQAKLLVKDGSHRSTKSLPKEWTRFDEWYNFKQLNKDVHVLMTIDETSYSGGKNGPEHPMAWWHKFEGGRVFYTGLGHTDESYTEPLFIGHLTGGILFAMGK